MTCDVHAEGEVNSTEREREQRIVELRSNEQRSEPRNDESRTHYRYGGHRMGSCSDYRRTVTGQPDGRNQCRLSLDRERQRDGCGADG